MAGDQASSAENGSKDPHENFSQRLTEFRRWLTEDAGATLNPGICIVNGEATDGSKNAPVLQVGSPNGQKVSSTKGRLGVIDQDGDQALFDCTPGCQVRTTKELKPDEVIMEIPKSAMVTPDLVAASDAGRAVRACCSDLEIDFWDCFENTTNCEENYASKVDSINTGPNLLLKILNERKVAESASSQSDSRELVSFEPGKVSTRAPYLAFLIHQRFSDPGKCKVKAGTKKSEKQFDEIRGKVMVLPDGAPSSFGPYARTLPSIVGLPLCWKREDLALLCGIPGVSVLKDVAKSTMSLASEFVSLQEAGISEKFPDIFPPGLLTWDRWIWAASIHRSRLLPFSCYGHEDSSGMQSPLELWKELGVMVPCLDMLNHESGSDHIRWESEWLNGEGESEPQRVHDRPRAVLKQKVKKGNEIFTSYGSLTNVRMLTQYGFAQIDNREAEVVIGWSMSDCVGRKEKGDINRFVIRESSDKEVEERWWSQNRFDAIRKEVFVNREQDFVNFQAGSKIRATVHNDGKFDEFFLALLVFATMPGHDLDRLQKSENEKGEIVLSSMHRTQLLEYMSYFYSQKLEKLLGNLDKELKNRFGDLNLWTLASNGGLDYSDQNEDGEVKVGWFKFFEQHAYSTAIEVEGNYYAMSPKSCALALYDGQLRALSRAIDACEGDGLFPEELIEQFRSMGFSLESLSASGSDKGDSQNGKKSPRKRKRKSKKGLASKTIDREGAAKLHLANLAFDTTPAILIDYFSSRFGRENVYECQVPQEKDSSRSRGYGFITVNEAIVNQVLDPSNRHEVDGRPLKVSKSTSTAAIAPTRSLSSGQASASNERCMKCGYRPKYCDCDHPDFRELPRDRRDEPRRDDYRRYDRGYSPDYDSYRRRRDDDRDRRYRYDDHYGRDMDYYGDRRSDRRDRSSERSRSSSRRRHYEDEEYRSSSRRRSRSDSRERSRKRRRSRSPAKSPVQEGEQLE